MTDLYFCPKCQKVTQFSVNWVHSLDGKWYHECWECESVLETEEKAAPFDQSDKSPQKGEGKSLDAPETEPLPHALDRRGTTE